eukprot:108935-Amphidinium_carterae.1
MAQTCEQIDRKDHHEFGQNVQRREWKTWALKECTVLEEVFMTSLGFCKVRPTSIQTTSTSSSRFKEQHRRASSQSCALWPRVTLQLFTHRYSTNNNNYIT